ncbi:3',5'-cyclic-nucleotide phosphodiesterase [Paludibacterium paludis]|uniref:Metallo-beta-lactamase domain-containing protein n=1 Tax=Paludibacterium paludis TaxID=1225769 RepID=A0A918NX79_9NEIS|nr:3',5'-cyclic-nucleotide phosphodiesterase [Paludibacterium paludis]GGY04220.1 hypothetical protein GCM10011289_03310 [Paludibacterium paludis]
MRVKALGTFSHHGLMSRTTSFQIDDTTLIDCGPGVEDLPTDELLRIDRVFLTHSHADHCQFLPMLADLHASHGGPGFTVVALQETLDALTNHMFNGVMWHDYTRQRLPSGDAVVRLAPTEVGDALPLMDGLVTALPCQHTVPAAGWLVEGPWRALAFTGDSSPCAAFWHWISNVPSLSDVVCELNFPDSMRDFAEQAGHQTPSGIAPFLDLMPPNIQLWVSHMERGHEQAILDDLAARAPAMMQVEALQPDTVIDL